MQIEPLQDASSIRGHRARSWQVAQEESLIDAATIKIQHDYSIASAPEQSQVPVPSQRTLDNPESSLATAALLMLHPLCQRCPHLPFLHARSS